MNKTMMKIREFISLISCILMLGIGIWVGMNDSWISSLLYFGIGILIFLFYILRRRLRLKMEAEEKK